MCNRASLHWITTLHCNHLALHRPPHLHPPPNTTILGSRLRSGPIWIRVKLWPSQIRLKIRIIFNGECRAAATKFRVLTKVHNCWLSGSNPSDVFTQADCPAMSFVFVCWQIQIQIQPQIQNQIHNWARVRPNWGLYTPQPPIQRP